MRKIYLITLIASIVFFSTAVNAQQAAQYSLFNFNIHNFNPAYAGLDNSVSATGVFRRQWSGLEGAPLTQAINVHSPVRFLNSAFGLKLENDALGAEENLTAELSYAYQTQLSKGNWLSIGVSGGILQKSLDGTILNPPNLDEPDDLIPLIKVTEIAPNANVGVFFKNDFIKAGVSVNNLLESIVPFEYSATAGVQMKRNYTALLSYKYEFGNQMAIEPAVLVKSDFTETQVDLSVILYYGERIFGGGSFRGYNQTSIDAAAAIIGWKANENVMIAYSYDVPLSALSTVNSGSHEIMINYNLNKVIGNPLPARIIYNPRFLY